MSAEELRTRAHEALSARIAREQRMDAAWAEFLTTPLWTELSETFRAIEDRLIASITTPGRSAEDRAYVAGSLQTVRYFTQRPELALRRLHTRAPETVDDGDPYRPARQTEAPGLLG